MSEPFRIQLKSDVHSYAVYAPRRIPLPLLPKIKDEIDRLLSFGVIERVEEPTQWCAPKAQGIRLCADLFRVNESMTRKRHVLPSVDQVLAQLTGAQMFKVNLILSLL